MLLKDDQLNNSTPCRTRTPAYKMGLAKVAIQCFTSLL